jgi:hypothetical protein
MLKNSLMLLNFHKLSIYVIYFILLLILVIVILAAEFLHIFIHVFIGHLSEDQMDDGYQNYKNLLFL